MPISRWAISQCSGCNIRRTTLRKNLQVVDPRLLRLANCGRARRDQGCHRQLKRLFPLTLFAAPNCSMFEEQYRKQFECLLLIISLELTVLKQMLYWKKQKHRKRKCLYKCIFLKVFFLGSVQPQGPNFLSPWATMFGLQLDYSTAALTIPQKVLPIWRLVGLKILDFSEMVFPSWHQPLISKGLVWLFSWKL